MLYPVLASAGTITRTVTYDDVYFNGSNGMVSFIYRTAWITLTPSPRTDFDMPGYAVIETLPSGFELLNVTADMNKTDTSTNTLRMVKWGPGDLKYKVKLPKTTSAYSIIGTFKDENKNVGTIPATSIIVTPTPTSTPSPGSDSGSGTSKKDDSAWSPSKTPVPTSTMFKISEAIGSPNATENTAITGRLEQGMGGAGKPTDYGLMTIIALIAAFIIIVCRRTFVSKKPVLIAIKSKNNKIYVNGTEVILPYSIDLENPKDKVINIYIKSSTPDIDIQPKVMEIPAKTSKSITISAVRDGCIGSIEIKRQTAWVIGSTDVRKLPWVVS